MISKFSELDLKKLYIPPSNSTKTDNGQVTIIGGSKLFHGAPLFALTTASRIVDMVFFASPEPSVGKIAEQIKSKLFSFIWVPWEEAGEYVKKSDACLIGPGLMRFTRESQMTNDKLQMSNYDKSGLITKKITHDLLLKFSDKRWVIDAGSLQELDPIWIPKNSILTPNKKEYEALFGEADPQEIAKKYNCVIVVKGPTTFVYSKDQSIKIEGGNAGLTKGGSGDVESGLTAALFAKNDAFLAASAASFIIKKSADELYNKVGPYYNSDDLAKIVPEVLSSYTK